MDQVIQDILFPVIQTARKYFTCHDKRLMEPHSRTSMEVHKEGLNPI